MSSKDSVSKISLSSFDDLFQTDESREDLKKEKLTDIPLTKIQDFPDHPYQVKDDESMDLLIDSIKSRGLIQPVLVRPVENGMYEMVSGHRRKRAFELIGIDKIPARVQELTRDEAILSMVDSNLQREVILPSEKAFAYKMKIDAAKRRGLRSDLTFSPVGKRLNTYEQIAEEAGDSRNQVHRFIRLTYLIKPILNLVDEKLIGMRPAVEISYLSEEQQNWLYEAIEYATQIADIYRMNDEQKAQINELLSPEYDALWNDLIGSNGMIINPNTSYIGTGIFAWPLDGDYTITSPFGTRSDPFTGQIKTHGGTDIAAPMGTPLLAAADGTVVTASYYDGGYGFYVKIKHDDTYTTLYGHCSVLHVTAGQTVKQGQLIAEVGSTGKSTGPHVHYEVIQNGVRVDAMWFYTQK